MNINQIDIYLNIISNSIPISLLIFGILKYSYIQYKKYIKTQILNDLLIYLKTHGDIELDQKLQEYELHRIAKLSALQKLMENGF